MGKDYGWQGGNYLDLADDGYRHNAIVGRCVDEIVSNACMVDWLAYRGDKELTQSAHYLNRFIARPNPSFTLKRLVGRMLFDWLLDGNIFCEAINREGFQRGTMELWPHRPDRVSPVESEGPYPSRYDITVGNAKRRSIYVDQATGRSDMFHLKTFNPHSDLRGTSPLLPAWYSIQVHNAQQKWAHNLVKNNCRPSLAVIFKDTELTEVQRAALRDEMSAFYSGPNNAGRPLIMEGNASVEPFGFNPQEVDFVESANQSARLIAGVLGIPAQLLGIPGDNTYSNLREARRALFEQTILPLLEMVKVELNNFLGLDDIYLDYDADSIPSMLPKREMLFTMLEKAGFLTYNEKREMLGFSPIEGGDVLSSPPPPEGGEEPGEEQQIRENERSTDAGANEDQEPN